MNKDKIDVISEDLIEKSGMLGEKVGPTLVWLGKHGFKLLLAMALVSLACLVAFGRGIFDPLKPKNKEK